MRAIAFETEARLLPTKNRLKSGFGAFDCPVIAQQSSIKLKTGSVEQPWKHAPEVAAQYDVGADFPSEFAVVDRASH